MTRDILFGLLQLLCCFLGIVLCFFIGTLLVGTGYRLSRHISFDQELWAGDGLALFPLMLVALLPEIIVGILLGNLLYRYFERWR